MEKEAEKRAKSARKFIIFATFCKKNGEIFFCIILGAKFCVKINSKLQKNTAQIQNLCYNIHVEKQRILLFHKRKRKYDAFFETCSDRTGRDAWIRAENVVKEKTKCRRSMSYERLYGKCS